MEIFIMDSWSQKNVEPLC